MLALGGDGDLDAFESIGGTNGNRASRVWRNNGSGTFSDSGQILGDHYSRRVSLGDLDGDGDVDIAVTNISANTVSILINQGKRRFAEKTAFQVGAQFPFALVGADIDRDGVLAGINWDSTLELAASVAIPVIASGGLASMDDIERLTSADAAVLEGAISGRALYDGRLDPAAALAAVAGAA